MTARVLVVEIGATRLAFAHTDRGGAGPPSVGRLERPTRSVAPNWYTGLVIYAAPPAATAELQRLHSIIAASGDTVDEFGVVEPDVARPTGLQAASSKVLTRLARARAQPRAMGADSWGAPAGFPQPTIISTAAAAAQQIGDALGGAGRVVVIDVGARAARIGLVDRVGGQFELTRSAPEVPAGGGDYLDGYIARLAMQADARLYAVQTAANPVALESFFASVGEAKHALSTETKSSVRANVNGELIETEIWRHWLDPAVAAATQAIVTTARPLLAMRPDVVLLVGGAAKFRPVADSLRTALGQGLTIDTAVRLASGGLKRMLAAPATTRPPVTVVAPDSPRPAGGGWTLAIDFGTTYTATVVAAADGTRHVIDVEGKGHVKMPSSVVRLEDGTLEVGRRAVSQKELYPSGFEATPKRKIGDEVVLLGGEKVAVVDLVAAVLRRCADKARERQGGTDPAAVRLTHPAGWARPRLDVLREAAGKAGLGDPELIPEPVAAAYLLPAEVAQAGRPIAIYDYGGGTFDAAVLRPTATGFEVAGKPGGRDDLGGVDIDKKIIDFLGDSTPGQRSEWDEMMTSEEVVWVRHQTDLRERVREAKEELSSSQQQATPIWISGLASDFQLTKVQLGALVEKDVDKTIAVLEKTINAAGLTPQELAAIYLIGGSSQLPMVAQKIWQHFQIAPQPGPTDPKLVVAEGAAAWQPILVEPPSNRPCRLGARRPATPGVVYRIEHRLSTDANDAVVQSFPNCWASLEAFVLERQSAIQQGAHYGKPHHGSTLGADGAWRFPTTEANGSSYWQSYQIIGEWAIHSRWSQAAADIDGISIMKDPARWSPVRPPLEFAERGQTPPLETITIYTRAKNFPVEVVTRATSERLLPDERPTEWPQRFFFELHQRIHGAQPPSPSTFVTGTDCQVASYKDGAKRGRCWYGIVNQRGVSITVEAPRFVLPPKLALALRDSIAIFE